ncbi:MAG: protein kinase, partial [Myxococcota bacterium]
MTARAPHARAEPATDAILGVGLPPDDVAAERMRQQLRAHLVGEAESVRVGRYILADRLGAGGMGTVYRSRDPELARDVAVKLVPLPDDLPATHAVREARAMAGVAHPNVVPVYDVGIAGEELYVVMALVQGTTLRGWLAQPRAPSVDAVLAALVAAGRGLSAAPTARIVHHDINPHKVLVDG